MAKDKTCNLQCTKCNLQSECTSIDESLRDVRCGQNGGHLTDSCKVNLLLDGKPVFEITKIIDFGKKLSKKDDNIDENKE